MTYLHVDNIVRCIHLCSRTPNVAVQCHANIECGKLNDYVF